MVDEVRVFISHEREDETIAEKLYSDLEGNGIKPFMFEKDILPGSNVEHESNKIIRQCDFFIALFSDTSLSRSRGRMRYELNIAYEVRSLFSPDKIFIIPVRIDYCEINDTRLKDVHAADLFPSYEAGLNKIFKVLSHETASVDHAVSNDEQQGKESLPYNIKVISHLIGTVFLYDELMELCFDHYPVVYKNFPDGQLKSLCISSLLDYIKENGLIDHLLNEVNKRNPNQFERHEKYLLNEDKNIDIEFLLMDSSHYDFGKIKRFIYNVFSPVEFENFCSEHFKSVFNQFTSDMPQSDRIQKILDYVRRYRLVDNFIGELRKIKPKEFNTYKETFHSVVKEEYTDPQKQNENFNIRAIHHLINSSFEADGFECFCHDHFQKVFFEFGHGQSNRIRIDLLLEHAIKNKKLNEILTKIKDINPYQFNRYAKYVRMKANGSSDQLMPLKDDIEYDYSVIRKLITDIFQERGIQVFCKRHYNQVYFNFTREMSDSIRLLILLEYARRNGLVNELLSKLKTINPEKYGQYEKSLMKNAEKHVEEDTTKMETLFSLKDIRQLIEKSFKEVDFKFFCFDHFYEVYVELTNGMTMRSSILLLLEYAKNKNQTKNLIREIKRVNPSEYSHFEEKITFERKNDFVEGNMNHAEYDIRIVKQMINAALSYKDVKTLCFDHFYDVYENITPQTDNYSMITALIDHVKSNNMMGDLLRIVNELNPYQYDKFKESLLLDNGTLKNENEKWFVLITKPIHHLEVGKSIILEITISRYSRTKDEIIIHATDTQLVFNLKAETIILRSDCVQTFTLSDKQTDEIRQDIELLATRPGVFKLDVTISDPDGNFNHRLSVPILVKSREKEKHIELPSPYGPRPVRQSDLTLRVNVSDKNKANYQLQYIAYSPLPELSMQSRLFGKIDISKTSLSQIREQLSRIISEASNNQQSMKKDSLRIIGMRLYDMVFPQFFKDDYWRILRTRIRSILILTEPEPDIPWELIKPHNGKTEDEFWGERFAVTRFVEGLGAPLQYEFPLGPVAISVDGRLSDTHNSDEWGGMFSANTAPRMPDPLMREERGYLAAMKYDSPIWGLHFEGVPEQIAKSEGKLITQSEQTMPEKEGVQAQTLSFWSKRPMVTYGMLRQDGRSALTKMSENWISTFSAAGVGCFVGALWATDPEIDRLFWHSFYKAIWDRRPLGDAMLTARQLVRDTFPDSPDWLSYFAVGDPMARGYLPEQGRGYTWVECPSHDLDKPLSVGKTYNFYAGLADFPQPSYHGRRYLSPSEPIQSPHLGIFAPGFTIEPEEQMLMKRKNDHFGGEFQLRTMKPGKHDLVIQFLANGELMQTVDLVLEAKEG